MFIGPRRGCEDDDWSPDDAGRAGRSSAAWRPRRTTTGTGGSGHVEPGVTLQRAAEQAAEEAVANMPFLPGDRVWTDAPRPRRVPVRGRHRSCGSTRAASSTTSPTTTAAGDRVVLRLWSGALYLHVRDGRGHADFEIETPAGVVGHARPRRLPRRRARAARRGSPSTRARRRSTAAARARPARASGSTRGDGRGADGPQAFDRAAADEFASWDDDREDAGRYARETRREYLPEDVAPLRRRARRPRRLVRRGRGRQRLASPRVRGLAARTRTAAGCWTPYGWTWVPHEPWGWAPVPLRPLGLLAARSAGTGSPAAPGARPGCAGRSAATTSAGARWATATARSRSYAYGRRARPTERVPRGDRRPGRTPWATSDRGRPRAPAGRSTAEVEPAARRCACRTAAGRRGLAAWLAPRPAGHARPERGSPRTCRPGRAPATPCPSCAPTTADQRSPAPLPRPRYASRRERPPRRTPRRPPPDAAGPPARRRRRRRRRPAQPQDPRAAAAGPRAARAGPPRSPRDAHRAAGQPRAAERATGRAGRHARTSRKARERARAAERRRAARGRAAAPRRAPPPRPRSRTHAPRPRRKARGAPPEGPGQLAQRQGCGGRRRRL